MSRNGPSVDSICVFLPIASGCFGSEEDVATKP